MGKKLELESDYAFQKKDWQAERVLWFLLLLFFLAGISGLFGRGGLSNAKAGSESEKIEIEYQRFLRYHTQDRIDITLHDIPANAEIFNLELDKEYMSKVQIERIQPQPQKAVVSPNGLVYIFENGGANQAKIYLYLHPDALGNVETNLKFNGRNPIKISQYIYP